MTDTSLQSHTLTMTVLMTPDMANFTGNVHGGDILRLLDQVAYACSSRYAGCYMVTVSVDRVTFLKPVYVGELLTFMASVNFTGTKSVEVGIKTVAENIRQRTIRHVNSCFFTMVAVNDQGETIPVTPFVPSSPDQKRRHAGAQIRRQLRKEADDRASELFAEVANKSS